MRRGSKSLNGHGGSYLPPRSHERRNRISALAARSAVEAIWGSLKRPSVATKRMNRRSFTTVRSCVGFCVFATTYFRSKPPSTRVPTRPHLFEKSQNFEVVTMGDDAAIVVILLSTQCIEVSQDGIIDPTPMEVMWSDTAGQ